MRELKVEVTHIEEEEPAPKAEKTEQVRIELSEEAKSAEDEYLKYMMGDGTENK